jgi:hypothetical protein
MTAMTTPLHQSLADHIRAVDDHDGATRSIRPEMFTNPSEGRLGVWARPGCRRISWVASDLLSALGADDGVRGAGRDGEGRLENVLAWSLARGISDVFIQNAWLLPYHVLTEMLETVPVARWTLWLVGDTGYTDRYRAVVAQFCRTHGAPAPAPVTAEEFLATWEHLLDSGPAPGLLGSAAADAPWPTRLPSDDFTTFRAACRDLLPEAEFRTLDTYFQSAFATATDLAHDLPTGTIEREQALAGWFHQQWRAVESWQQFLVLVRATQVALFRAGLHLRVDLDRLVGTATTTPQQALRSSETWNRLLTYPEPCRGAACALAAEEVTVRQMRALTVAQVDVAGRSVEVGGASVAVRADARVFLRAQRHLRTLQTGTRQKTPFFADKQGRPQSEPALARYVTDARRELGVAVSAGRQLRDVSTGSRWMTRWGLSAQKLT